MSTPRVVPGPESAKLAEEEQEWLAPGIQRLATLAGIAMRSGQGVVLEDEDGNSYLDFMAGVCVASLGHSHPRWVAAIQRQAAQLAVGFLPKRGKADAAQADGVDPARAAAPRAVLLGRRRGGRVRNPPRQGAYRRSSRSSPSGAASTARPEACCP